MSKSNIAEFAAIGWYIAAAQAFQAGGHLTTWAFAIFGSINLVASATYATESHRAKAVRK